MVFKYLLNGLTNNINNIIIETYCPPRKGEGMNFLIAVIIGAAVLVLAAFVALLKGLALSQRVGQWTDQDDEIRQSQGLPPLS